MRKTSHSREGTAGGRGWRATAGPAGRALLALALLAWSGPAGASIRISEQSLQFGKQEVGTTSATRSIKIQNDSIVPVVVFGVFIGGSNTSDYLLVANGCGWLNLKGECAIGVQFKPQAEGIRSAHVSIVSTAPGSPHIVTLQGEGTVLRYTLSPSQLDFGDQVVGQQSAPLIVTLTNTGSAELRPVPVFDGDGDDFALLPGCEALRPGDRCELRVVFKPSRIGLRRAVLTLGRGLRGTRAEATQLALTGYGIHPSLRISTRRLDFGVQAVGTAVKQTVTLANVGSAPVSIRSFDFTSDRRGLDDGFRASSDGCILALQTSCTITTTFEPKQAKAYSALLDIYSSASADPLVLELVGTGGPKYTLSPSLLDFGDQYVGTTATQTVTITNNMDRELALPQSRTVTTTQFVIGDECDRIPARASCQLAVEFRPSQRGRFTLVLFEGYNPNAEPILVITGNGIDPALRLSTQRLDFGVEAVGSKSVPHSVTLTNAGSTSLTITEVRISSGSRSKDGQTFEFTSGCKDLAPGQRCSISVVFAPTEARDYSAALLITSGAGSRLQQVELAGTGGPAYILSPQRLDFGDQEVGTKSAPRTVTITNLRNSELETKTLFEGSQTEFRIDGEWSESRCQKIPAGGSCQFQVTFRPGRVGPTGAILQLLGREGLTRSEDYPIVAPPLELTGNGVPAGSVAPRYQSMPPPGSTLDAGASPVGSPTTVPLTIENVGNALLRIEAPTLTGDNAADFRISAPATFPLTLDTPSSPGGGRRAIQIEFTPGAPGPRTVTLELPTNDPDQPKARYTVTGTGVGARLSLSASSISFGSHSVGTTSPEQLLVVTNTGNTDLILNGVGFSGIAPDDFTLRGACGLVPPGGSCILALRFTPAGPGSRTAELTIFSNAPWSPSTVALAGNGLAPVLRIDPASLSFGPVNVGENLSLPLTLTNTGNAPLTIHSLTVGGEHPLDFQVVASPSAPAPGSGLPAGLCPTLEPNASCQVLVAFAPLTFGQRSGTLAISSDAPGSPHVVSLSGIGLGNDLSINLTATPQMDTDGVQITYTLTVTNNGTQPVGNIRIQHQLPAESGFESVSAGEALVVTPAVGESGRVTFDLDAMAAQDQVTFQVVVRLGPNPPASVSSSADVAASTPDANPSNNSVAISTPVPGP